MASTVQTRHCPKCGPRRVTSARHPEPGFIVCPTCGLDEIEYAYIERLLTVGFDAVYRQEHRAFQAQRRKAVA
jgi:uncharacterized Zn finger protein (UPF0148 family)